MKKETYKKKVVEAVLKAREQCLDDIHENGLDWDDYGEEDLVDLERNFDWFLF
jgi:hypothetical protein